MKIYELGADGKDELVFESEGAVTIETRDGSHFMVGHSETYPHGLYVNAQGRGTPLAVFVPSSGNAGHLVAVSNSVLRKTGR